MVRSARALAVLWLLAAGCSAHLDEGQRFVGGEVRDSDGRPLARAVVRFQGSGASGLTDDAGRFALPLDMARSVHITAGKEGYFNGGQPLEPGKRMYRIVLKGLPPGDNQRYRWLPPRKPGRGEGQGGKEKACQECHQAPAVSLFDEWDRSAHARSATNPLFLAFFNGLAPLTQGLGYKLDFPPAAGNCAACHAPAMALRRPFGSDPTQAAGVEKEGVFCDLCHKVEDVTIDTAGGRPGILSMTFKRPPDGDELFLGPLDDVFPGPDGFRPLYRESRYGSTPLRGSASSSSPRTRSRSPSDDCAREETAMHRPPRVKRLLAALFLLGSLADAADSPAEWVSTGGPLGGLGYDVRIHPANKNLMFVTDNFAGIIRSFDGGATWAQSNTGINVAAGGTADAVPIFSVTIDPNNPGTVWAGTNAEGDRFGIFKSTDGGTQWTLKTTGVSTEGRGIVFRGFTVQPGSSSVVYAMAELPMASQGREFNRVKGRVYKTSNGGDSWTKIWEGDNLARYLIIDPASPATLYLSTGIFDREAYNSDCGLGIPGGVGVLKSTDGGATWAPVNSGLTDLYVGSLRMHPGNSQVLFAATGNNACSGQYGANVVSGLFKTMDGGASWAKVISADFMTTVNFSPSSPDIMYAGSARAFYQSADGGATWTRFSRSRVLPWGPEGIRAGVPIDVVIDPVDPTLIYANNYGGGVFRSGDGARTWAAWSKGYSGADIHAVHVPTTAPGSVLAIGRSGPFKSTNSGGDWVGIANGEAQFAEWNTVVAHPANADAVLITDEHQGKILRSVDGGASFVTVLTHPSANAADVAARQGFKGLAFAPSNPSVVYAGLARERNAIDSGSPAGTVAYKSTNGGVSFAPAGPELDGKSVRRLAVHPTDADTVWAATTAGLFRSTNGGANWAPLGLAGRNITGLAVDAASNYLIAGEKDGGVWISDNGGASWTGPHNTGFSSPNPFVSALVIDPASPTVAYAADKYSGVYRSTDKGRTWSPFPDAAMTGLSFRAVKDLALGPGVLYAATEGGGVFRHDGLPSASFSITGSTSGALSALILTADVQPAAADEGLPRNIYVAALVGPQLYVRTPSGWQRWTGGPLPVYASGPMSRRTLTLLDGTIDMTGLPGVEFYVGYGTDENDLLTNRRYAKVYTVR